MVQAPLADLFQKVVLSAQGIPLGPELPSRPKSGRGTAPNPAPTRPAVDRARMELLAQENKEITTLYNIGVAVGSSLDLDEVIWTLHKESSRLVDTSNIAIILYDDQTGRLNFCLVYHQGQPVEPEAVKLSYHEGLIGQVLTSRTPLLAPDLMAKELTESGSALSELQIRSWLGVPILNPGFPHASAQGMIATWSYEANAFTDHDLWLFSAIATQAAIAIRNARLHEAVLAERDRVIAAEEQARRVLARALHDGPTQSVSALSMRLDHCQNLLAQGSPQLAEELDSTRELARLAVHQIRTLLFELRPLVLKSQGLTGAIKLFLERRQQERGTQPKLSLRIEPMPAYSAISRQEEKVEAALFAIVQETVNNALKYARAKNIGIELRETPAALYLAITDDGVGFDVDQVMSDYEQRTSLGMLNIRERADLIGGELILISTPGQGTQVSVRVPKAESERKKRRGSGPLRLKR